MSKITEMSQAGPVTGSELVEIIQGGENKRVSVAQLAMAGQSAYQAAVAAGYVGSLAAWLLSLKGLKGDKGDTGAQGVPGAKGNTGDPGLQGFTGARGLTGDKGDQGDVGDPGITGAKGEKGDPGEQGIQGLRGFLGLQGTQGIQGIPGVAGTAGTQGIQGEPGVQGDKGDPGEQGIQGIPGSAGTQGIQGIPGVKGDPGEQGPAGNDGAQGLPGDGLDLGYTPEDAAKKGQPNGYAGLDGSGRVPSDQLPSYVDDIVEVLDFADLPAVGESSKIYVTIDDDKLYRWSGSDYINFKSAPNSSDDIPEGTTNLYYSDEKVLNVPLTALSTALGTPVTSTDDVLTAIGKLQAQASANKTASKWFLILACSDEESPLTVANGETVFRMPFNVTLSEVRASLTQVQGSGAIFTVDIKMNGVSILTTLLTIDNNEKTSLLAQTPCVIGTTLLTDNAEISITIAQVGDNTATGLKVSLIGAAS